MKSVEWSLWDSVKERYKFDARRPVKRMIVGTKELAEKAKELWPGVIVEVDGRLGPWGYDIETERP